MVIVLTGGGSGGHITPLLAIAAELKKLEPRVEIAFVGQKGDSFSQQIADCSEFDKVFFISAGKFRRYYHEGWRQIEPKTLVLNIRDLFRTLIGCIQSWCLLGKLKPAAVFINGGFVGVPIGLAAAVRKIPYVTHDSDVAPGLANRIIGRWAKIKTVAVVSDEYKNNTDKKVVVVGIPIAPGFKQVTKMSQDLAKGDMGISKTGLVLLVTGGGLGAKSINDAMVNLAPKLMVEFPSLTILHVAGKDNQEPIEANYHKVLESGESARVRVFGFTDEMQKMMTAADVIITRAGATTLAEIAALAKPSIVVPHATLSAGHQLKNAKFLSEKRAVLMVTDGSELNSRLGSVVNNLLSSVDRRKELSTNIKQFSRLNAGRDIAEILLQICQDTSFEQNERRQDNNKTNI